MNTIKALFCLVWFCFAFNPSLTHAQEDANSWSLSLKGGVLFPGEVYYGFPILKYFDTETGAIISINADFRVSKRLSLGVFALYWTEDNIVGDVYTVGGTFKAHFNRQGSWQIRPAAVVGLQFFGDTIIEDALGLDVGALLEIAKPVGGGRALVGELGFIAQPTGGNDQTDFTFDPILYLSVWKL